MLSNESLLTFSHERYIWKFYKDPQDNLSSCKYDTSVHAWSEEDLLVTGFKKEYSIALDHGEKIHLAAEGCDGKLNYLYWDGNGWSETTRLKVYNQNQISNLTLSASCGLIHLIYLSKGEDANANVRIHQYFDGQNWSEPRLLNTIGTPCGKAIIQISANGQHHLVCQETNEGKDKLKHYIFDRHKKKWLKYQYYLDITEKSANSGFEPCMIVDRNNKLHLVWLSSDGMNFLLLYRRYQNSVRSLSGWTRTKTISLPNVNAYSPIIIIIENDLLVLWQQIDGIYISISRDWGNSWSEPEKKGQLQDFMQLNYLMSEKFNQGHIDLVRTFSATSPQLMLLAAYLHAAKSLGSSQLSQPREETKDSINDLPTVQYPDDFQPNSIQPVYSDKHIYPLSFTMEDNRLTSQQMATTIKRQQEQVDYTNNKIERITQNFLRLEKQINNNNELIRNMQQEIEQFRLDNTQKNEDFKNIGQKICELKNELAQINKMLQIWEQKLAEQIKSEVLPGYYRKKYRFQPESLYDNANKS